MKKQCTLFVKTALVWLLCVISAVSSLSLGIAADTPDIFSSRYNEPIVLPYKNDHTFSHTKASRNTDTTPDPQLLTFHAPTMSIVTICYTKGKGPEGALSDVTVSVYTDTAQLIVKRSAAGDGVSLMQFIPVYTGTYHVMIESRSASEGDFTASVEISSSTGYSQNKIAEFPHSKQYTKRAHKTNKVRDLYPKTMYPTTEYLLSVFEIEHEAGCILSYKINSTDSSAVHAVLYTDDGSMYTPHQSHASDGYMAGDAQELYYKNCAYLFVYSTGEFTLEMNTINHEEYKISSLPSDCKGEIDVSDAALMYDEAKLEALIGEFPFCSIKNRNVKFFSIKGEEGSVISYLSERKEHASFSLVSDEEGLSHLSRYPLREYNDYCSEVDPTELCYNSVISDSGKVYLAYTGTDTKTYIELFSSPTHTTLTTFEKKYSEEDPLPLIAIRDIYHDREIYDSLGIEHRAADITKINGYMLVSEDNYRHYYEGTGVITPPAQKGKYKLYVIINSTYKDAHDRIEQRYYAYPITEITVPGKFSIPTVDDIINAVSNKDPLALILIPCFFILIVGGIVISVRGLIIKYSLTKEDIGRHVTVTDHVKRPDSEETQEKETQKTKGE